MKSLFLPLKTEFYDAFKCCEKRVEYRLYGKRWNEKTCIPGREIILSKGYGSKNRIKGKIVSFYTKPKCSFSEPFLVASITACFGTAPAVIACIEIDVNFSDLRVWPQ